MNELKFDSKLSSIYILLSSFSFEVFFLYISRQISHLTYHKIFLSWNYTFVTYLEKKYYICNFIYDIYAYNEKLYNISIY